MGRPANAKNGSGMNGSTGARSVGLRAAKTVKVKTTTTTKPQPSSGGQNSSEGTSVKTDRSQTNFPYDVRLGGFSSLYNAVNKGTSKVKRILTEECDYIMECRVCRNLFRSLPNFLTHKQNFCKKQFDSTWSIGLSNLIQTSDTTKYNIQFEVDPDLLLEGDCNAHQSSTNDTAEGSKINSIAESDWYKDMSAKSLQSSSSLTHDSISNCRQSPSKDNESIHLQVKHLAEGPSGSVIVEQRLVCDPSNCDITSAHLNPVAIVNRDTAILGPDGQVMCTGTSKGIENVVAKLTARMRAMEELNAQKVCTSTISCEICKTVFDSDKALRQHRREGLDCGRTWGFKSPGAQSSPSKKIKINDKYSSPEAASSQDESVVDSSQSPVRISKLFSPAQARRNSHKRILQSTAKAKRALSLSPVKKIKKKYSRLDGPNDDYRDDAHHNLFSCGRCSSSFNTKHEMSMHLALCTGVINYFSLRRGEPPTEKIGISIRHEFAKTPVPSKPFPPTKRKVEIGTAKVFLANPSFKVSRESQQSIHTNVPNPSAALKLDKQSSGTLLRVSASEVNNNREYKVGNSSLATITYSRSKHDSIDDTSSEDQSPTKSGIDFAVDYDGQGGDVDISSSDSGVCSEAVVSLIKSETNITEKSCTSRNSSKPLSPPKSRKAKPSKVIILGQVSTRLEANIRRSNKPKPNDKAFNLRKAINSRIRKSRRIHRPSLRVAVH